MMSLATILIRREDAASANSLKRYNNSFLKYLRFLSVCYFQSALCIWTANRHQYSQRLKIGRNHQRFLTGRILHSSCTFSWLNPGIWNIRATSIFPIQRH